MHELTLSRTPTEKIEDYFLKACENNDLELAQKYSTNLQRDSIIRILRKKEHSPLWLACKNGHVNMVNFLMCLDPQLINKAAPDGTTAELVAFVQGHDYITKHLKNQFNLSLAIEETNFGSDEHQISYPKNLTRQYPIFNSEIEEPLKLELNSNIEEKAINDLILSKLCPIPRTASDILVVNDIELRSCELDCQR